MLSIDEGGDAARLLSVGYHMKRQCGLSAGFLTITFNDTPARETADTKGEIERKCASGDDGARRL